MNSEAASLLLIGESETGKTHFGAQLLRRLSLSSGALQMNGAATNLDPFQTALDALSEGRLAKHTPGTVYVESLWPVRTSRAAGTIVWPDYGGEQVKNIIETRRFPAAWRDRIIQTDHWLLMIRLRQTRLDDDLFSKPISALSGPSATGGPGKPSDQARLIELLQMLMHLRVGGNNANLPRLSLLLSCWDEIGGDQKPDFVLRDRLPMFRNFVLANWPDHSIVGLSALGRPLSKTVSDEEYIEKGPESFGYIVDRDGEKSADLTLPIAQILEAR